MRKATLASLAILLATFLAPGEPTAAQEWSPEQDEVLSTLHDLWRYSSAGDFESWYALVSEEYRGWSVADPMPFDKEASRRRNSQRVWKRTFYRIHPLAVDIHGDVAIVFYSFVADMEHPDGSRSTSSGRWTDVFRREGERWLLVADAGGATE
jgi:ketosteroid isomerase-like protein